MEITNNVGRQRTIRFNFGYNIKKQKRKNEAGTIFKFYSPKHFANKSTQHLPVNVGVDVELPDGRS